MVMGELVQTTRLELHIQLKSFGIQLKWTLELSLVIMILFCYDCFSDTWNYVPSNNWQCRHCL